MISDKSYRDMCSKENFERKGFVCYCFKFTREDIKRDISINGRSTIMERIMSEKKAGGCDCATQSPKGR